MAKITYTNKVALNVNADVPDINKVKADDMNEIKSVVNTNADTLDDIAERDVYSTTETVVGTWIDGKPIYRKVFEFTTGANNTFINVDFNEKSVVDKVVKLEGCFRRDSDIFVFNTYRSNNAYTCLLFSQINGLSVLVYQPDGYYSNKPAWAMIEYTKTTD